MKHFEIEIDNEKKLNFDCKEYFFKLIKEEDSKQRINFILTPLFTDEYEYSAIIDYLEEKKTKKITDSIILIDDISDNSSLRDFLLDLMNDSKITNLNDNTANVYMEKSYVVFKKEKKYCYELELKKVIKNKNSNLFENDINFIDNQNSKYHQEQVCNLKFQKIENEIIKLSEIMESICNKNNIEIEALKNKCDKYEKQIEIGKLQISNLTNELTNIKNHFENSQEQIRNINNFLDFVRSEFNVILNKYENINNVLTEMNIKIQKNDESNLILKNSYDKASDSVKDIYNTVQKLLNENIDLERNVNDLKSNNEELLRNFINLSEENETIKKDYRDVLFKKDNLNEMESINESNDFEKINNKIIECKEILNNKISNNQKSIYDYLVVSNNIKPLTNNLKEKNIINLDEYNFISENSIKLGIQYI